MNDSVNISAKLALIDSLVNELSNKVRLAHPEEKLPDYSSHTLPQLRQELQIVREQQYIKLGIDYSPNDNYVVSRAFARHSPDRGYREYVDEIMDDTQEKIQAITEQIQRKKAAVARARARDILLAKTRNYADASSGLTEVIKRYIATRAGQMSIDPQRALKIAECENDEFDPQRSGPIDEIGIYQFRPDTWHDVNLRRNRAHLSLGDRADWKLNVDAALFLMSQGEYHHWNASKHCWQ